MAKIDGYWVLVDQTGHKEMSERIAGTLSLGPGGVWSLHDIALKPFASSGDVAAVFMDLDGRELLRIAVGELIVERDAMVIPEGQVGVFTKERQTPSAQEQMVRAGRDTGKPMARIAHALKVIPRPSEGTHFSHIEQDGIVCHFDNDGNLLNQNGELVARAWDMETPEMKAAIEQASQRLSNDIDRRAIEAAYLEIEKPTVLDRIEAIARACGSPGNPGPYGTIQAILSEIEDAKQEG